MRKMEKCMLAATLICGSTTVLTSCSDSNDNPVVKEKPTDYSQESILHLLDHLLRRKRGRP